MRDWSKVLTINENRGYFHDVEIIPLQSRGSLFLNSVKRVVNPVGGLERIDDLIEGLEYSALFASMKVLDEPHSDEYRGDYMRNKICRWFGWFQELNEIQTKPERMAKCRKFNPAGKMHVIDDAGYVHDFKCIGPEPLRGYTEVEVETCTTYLAYHWNMKDLIETLSHEAIHAVIEREDLDMENEFDQDDSNHVAMNHLKWIMDGLLIREDDDEVLYTGEEKGY